MNRDIRVDSEVEFGFTSNPNRTAKVNYKTLVGHRSRVEKRPKVFFGNRLGSKVGHTRGFSEGASMRNTVYEPPILNSIDPTDRDSTLHVATQGGELDETMKQFFVHDFMGILKENAYAIDVFLAAAEK